MSQWLEQNRLEVRDFWFPKLFPNYVSYLLQSLRSSKIIGFLLKDVADGDLKDLRVTLLLVSLPLSIWKL